MDEEDVDGNHKFIPNSSKSHLRQSQQKEYADIDAQSVKVSLNGGKLNGAKVISSASLHKDDESRAYSPDVNNYSQ